MQITGKTTSGNEAALFMETSGIVGDRFILTLPGYGPESCRSLSACLSAFSCFCHLTPSVFSPLFIAIFVVLYIYHALSAASVLQRFSISCLPLCLEYFLFLSVHILLSLFHLLCCQTSKRQLSGCQRDDSVSWRRAQSLPAMKSAPHARPARHMHL